uniref:Fatty acyl-CoA reductase n=1 Tax=Linum usitatissimum TaxID=4006 RepID=B1PAT2_LINUS|nr:male sterility-related protein [Linum usitatissimum]ACA28680.1 male sterility-related protein [Linum usitatissimum]
MDAASSLVLSPNGKGQPEIAVKDLIPPYGEPTSSSQDGIGIVRFLRGKGFFITGATGFLAKVLIEKILRTMPDIGKIYLLIKAKNKDAAMSRLKTEILNAELFTSLRQTYGKSYHTFMLSKLVPVAGDVCKSNLGLEQEIADLIADDVDVIVNSAANTTFDERYDVAIDINTRGPSNLMSFAKKCEKLKLFLQVSTAYVNGQRQGRIMERAFGMGDCIAEENSNPASRFTLDIEGEVKLVLDSKEAFHPDEIATKMRELGLERARKYGWQDTYVFTKAMGEMVIDNMRGEIPVVILRPSVIESTYKEPFPGWMEGNRMMDPIVLYYGKGQLTGFLVDPNGVLDVVPADMVVNATLAAMARHGMDQKPEINVYQIASSVVNPLIFKDLATLLYEHYNTSPYMDSNGFPITVPLMKLFSSMDEFSDHLWKDVVQRNGLTAAVASSDGKLSQKHEFICRKSVEQAKYLANIYEPYTFYGGRFDNSNGEGLMEMMSEVEKRKFGFDVGSIDWRDYITNVHIPGLRRHVMKGRGTSSSSS